MRVLTQALDPKNLGCASPAWSAIPQEIPFNAREAGGMRFLYP